MNSADDSRSPRSWPGALIDCVAIIALVVWVLYDKMSVFEGVGALIAIHSGRFSGLAARYLPRRKQGPPSFLLLLVIGSGLLSVVAGVLLLPRAAAELSRGLAHRALGDG